LKAPFDGAFFILNRGECMARNNRTKDAGGSDTPEASGETVTGGAHVEGVGEDATLQGVTDTASQYPNGADTGTAEAGTETSTADDTAGAGAQAERRLSPKIVM